MNPELISRLIGLVEKTGDKVVLADPETGKAVVVMDLASYERLIAGGQKVEVRSELTAAKETDPVVKINHKNGQKMAQPKENSGKKEKVFAAQTETAAAGGAADLTQEELLDKINREIAAWKTAQEKKRTEELKAAAKDVSAYGSVGILEEEERFYLEPIE
jgi:hypothetical protein